MKIEQFIAIVFAIAGTLLTYVAIENTVEYTGWLWLLALIVGPQCLIMSIRSSIR